MQHFLPEPTAPAFPFIAYGKHKTVDDGLCVLECVAFIAGESHTDAPHCVCPAVAALARAINDATDDEGRDILARRILQIASSNNGNALTIARLDHFVGQLTRGYLPSVLRAAAMPEFAEQLAALPPHDPGAAQAAVRAILSTLLKTHASPASRTAVFRATAFALGPVLGGLDLLLDGELPEVVVERLSRALGGCDIRTMIALLDDLLLMGDVDSGKDGLMVARLAELANYQARRAA